MLLNKERALELMARFEVDALVATTPENVLYFTGYAGWMNRAYREYHRIPGQSSAYTQAYGVLSRHAPKDISLIFPATMGSYIAQNAIWARDIQSYGVAPLKSGLLKGYVEEMRFQEIIGDKDRNSPGPGEALVKTLKEKGVDRGKIGLDLENISPSVDNIIRKELRHADVRNGSEVIRFIRMVKCANEVQKLRKAAEVNEKAYKAFVEHAAPSISENELMQTVREVHAKEGGVLEFGNCPSGRRGGGFFPPSNYKLKKGDLVMFDFGGIFDFYHSDTGGTLVLGKPTKKMKKVYSAVRASQQAVLDATRPDAKPSELATIANNKLKEKGLGPALGLGHGLGLEIRDYPIITRTVVPNGVSDGFLTSSTDIPMEEGMVMNHETPHIEFGWGGVQVEQTLIVTKKGCELLACQERILHVR